MNRALLGKSYEQRESFLVTDEGARAYAEATGADVAAYGEGALAPPMYGVAFSYGALTAPLLDGELGADLMRLAHTEQDMRFLAPVRAGDVIRSTSKILRIDERPGGELLVVGIESVSQRDEPVISVESGLFVGGPRRRGRAADADEGAAPGGFAALPRLFEERLTVAPDQGRRYAAASGDHNPIHVDDDVARMAGLPGAILHGLCTMAFVHNALVEHCGGDPMRIARLAVRFSRPVLMSDALLVDVRGPAAGPLALVVSNERGEPVLPSGLAELRG